MDALRALQNLSIGSKKGGPANEQMLKQAEQIWIMLDDMAEKDPQAYKRFIEKQHKEHEEFTAPPQPHMCVKGRFQSCNGGQLFINIVSWSRVPKPKSAEDNIPLFAAPLENIHEKQSGEDVSSVTIATNPEVLTEYGIEAKDAEERKNFISLCVDYVEHLCGRPVSRNFTLLPRSINFKGDLEKVQKFFADSLKKAITKDENSSAEEETPASDSDLPETVLSKLANIAVPVRKTHPPHFSSVTTAADATAPVSESCTNNLIQELHSEEMRLSEPQYCLKKSETGSGLVLRVELPGVVSVADCQLDISQDDIKLCVEGMYELTVSLPLHIDDTRAKAKFSRKTSLLTLYMPEASF